jgi:hypothetical protein
MIFAGQTKCKVILPPTIRANTRSAPQAGSEVRVAQTKGILAGKIQMSAGGPSVSVAKELKDELAATKMEMQKAMREMLSSIKDLASQKTSIINDDEDEGSGPSTRSGRPASRGKAKTSSKATNSTQNGLPPAALNAQNIVPSALTTQGFFSMGPTMPGFVPMGPTAQGLSHIWPTPTSHGLSPSTVPAGHTMFQQSKCYLDK